MAINVRADHDYWDPKRQGFVTNYPNFQHWRPMEPENLVTEEPINIYLHSPFCIQRCAYCYYKTVNLRGKNKRERMQYYVDALCREIELATAKYDIGNRPVKSIYFGGGTPSLLYVDQLWQVVNTLHDNLNISKENPPEFTLEAEPVTMTQEKADAFGPLGVTRCSMGVQSFDDDIIKASNRLDSEKSAIQAIELAMSTGAVCNIDLMSGLADETPEKWAHSVNTAIKTGIQSITVYKTELYINTPYYRDLRRQRLDLPDDDDELMLTRFAIGRLQDSGYGARSFNTWTLDGTPDHVHAPSVFRGDDNYAFGVSAFGKLGDTLFQNTNNEERYAQLVQEGQLPIQRGHKLTCLDSMIRDVVLSMKLITFDLRAFQNKYGFKLENMVGDTLDELVNDDFITVSDDEIRLTDKGVLHGDYTGKSLVKTMRERFQ